MCFMLYSKKKKIKKQVNIERTNHFNEFFNDLNQIDLFLKN